jgi:uracil-DNA glycosylase
MLPPTTPRGNRDRAVVEDKLARRFEPHVKALNELVEEINQETGKRAPWFDPDGGGVHAKVLFLLETPGTHADGDKGSGFISADNNDGTAETFFRIRDQAGLPRNQLVAWNIVPWYLPDGNRAGHATRQDIAEAQPWLVKLMGLLGQDLRLVVPMGVPARDGWMRLLATNPSIPLLPTLALPHPSPMNLHIQPESRDVIRAGLERVAAVVNGVDHTQR